jgi:hypothetical protein
MEAPSLSMAPLPVKVMELAANQTLCVMPTGDYILIICATQGSGKSTLISNFTQRVEYGLRGRPKHLISKQAQKGAGYDNPYDPAVIDDPEVECWPCEKLSEAENVFQTIRDRGVKKGDPKGVIIIDDYGP